MPTHALLKDPLTGVYSRAVLSARLEEELDRARRYQQPFSLLLLDLDHFKSINDAFGHSRGDRVLVEFARQLSLNVRGADAVFRYGGDEFVVLLPNTPKGQALSTAQRLIDFINSQTFTDRPPLSLSLSIGLAAYPQDESTPEGLFDIADRRHQLAKRLGRSQVISETPVLTARKAIDPPSRLIEQDMALAAVYQFLDTLPDNNRNVLHLAGQPATGTTRLQAEIRKIAHLRGYAVLAVASRTSIKNRNFAALLEAQEQLPGFNLNTEDEFPGQSLAKYLEEKGQSGIVITIDRLEDIDRGSLEFLRELFNSSELTQLGLVFSEGEATNLKKFPNNIPLQETIRLKPLSPGGLRIWLRQSLQWEAPQDFVIWLHQQTNGLPGNIQAALDYLYSQKILRQEASGWRFPDDLLQTSITQLLQRKPVLPPNNLPPVQVEIVDRVQDLETINSLVLDRQLVTIHGPGGSGKTTLALQAASEILEAFPDGLYFVKPSRTEDLRSALSRLLRLPGDPENAVGALLAYLQPRQVLFLLDQYTPAPSNQAVIQALLNKCEHVHFLLTSHTPAGIPGEQLYPLAGLDYPEINLESDLSRYSACTLFLQAAQRASSSFLVNASSAAWIAQICRLVEGLPLAIELAAAWVQTFDCEEIATRIAHSQALLADHSLPEQHKIVFSVLDAFWELLSGTDQRILYDLTVFNGVFRRELAYKVCAASPFYLDALAAKSLLEKTPQGQYQVPAFLRRYLKGKFSGANVQLEVVRDRHSSAYAQYADELMQRFQGELQQSAYLAILGELENFIGAWNWSIDSAATVNSLRLLPGLAAVFRRHGSYQEAFQLFAAARDRLNEAGSPPDGNLCASLALQAGQFAYLLGKYEASYQLLAEAAAVFKDCGRADQAAASLLYLSRTDAALNNQQHLEHARAGLQIYQELADQSGLCDSYNRLGILAAHEESYEQAQQYFEQAVAAAGYTEDRYRLARTRNNYGQLSMYQGELETAHHHLTASLDIARTLENPYLTAAVLDSLAKLAVREGDFLHAAVSLQEALQIARRLQCMPLALDLLASTAEMWGQAGRQPLAAALLRFLLDQSSLVGKERLRAKNLYRQYTSQLPQAQVDLAASLHHGKSLYALLEELVEVITEPGHLTG